MADIEKLAIVSMISALDDRVKLGPEKAWISIPNDNDDLSKGFQDVSYRQLACVVERAATWLDRVLSLDDKRIQIVAYLGTNDLYPAILAMAAANTGTQLLLPFPLAPAPSKRHLISAAGCGALLFPAPLASSIAELLENEPQIKRIVVPSFEAWFSEHLPPSARFTGNTATTNNRPWLIFHTSGTTGMPKLVTYTQEMLTSIALVDTVAAALKKRTPSMSLFKESRVHVAIPSVHLVGLISILVSPILLGTHMVLGPLDRPPSGKSITDVLRYGQVEGLTTPPVWLRRLCNNPDSLGLLRNLKFISWAGSALDKISGDILCQYTQLTPSLGTTECGPYWTWITEDPKDWAYYSFVEGQGIEFEETNIGLYELVIRKQPDAIWQQIFMLHPELDIYRTSDLFKKHPNKPDLWLYSGRTDDMFKLSNGLRVHYTGREQSIEEDPLVKTALIGGPGQAILFLLVELVIPSRTNLESIWQTIGRENQAHSEEFTIHQDMIILADSERPFKRTMKDTVLRKETFELYKSEIEQKLMARGHSWNILS